MQTGFPWLSPITYRQLPLASGAGSPARVRDSHTLVIILLILHTYTYSLSPNSQWFRYSHIDESFLVPLSNRLQLHEAAGFPR